MQGRGKNYEDCRSHGTLSSPALSALMAADAVVRAVCMSRVSISNPPLLIIIVTIITVVINIFPSCMSLIHERVGESPVHWLPPGVGFTQKPFSVSENGPFENFLRSNSIFI